MTEKYNRATGYSADRTKDCETVLVVLLQAFGSLKTTLRLVGGLVPRYLTPSRPPEVPDHVGTTDVDIVLNVSVLAAKGTYDKIKRQLKASGFKRYQSEPDAPLSSWQWEYELNGQRVVVEFLQHTEDPEQSSRLAEVDGEEVSACQILHAGIAFDWYEERQVKVDLPDGDGVVTETVRYADAVAFIVLKAIAFDNRHEHKDAADLIHVMRYFGPIEKLAAMFAERMKDGQYSTALVDALDALERRFCDDDETEGHRKDGPAKVARFHGLDSADQDVRIREQRDISGLVTHFLSLLEESGARRPRQALK
jgi:hypothetical protein